MALNTRWEYNGLQCHCFVIKSTSFNIAEHVRIIQKHDNDKMRYLIHVEILNTLEFYKTTVQVWTIYREGLWIRFHVSSAALLACNSPTRAWYNNFWSCAAVKADFLTESQKESLTAKRRGQVPFLLLSFSSSKFPWPPDPLQFDRVNPALPFHACCMFRIKAEKLELERHVSTLRILPLKNTKSSTST